jgi:hypothetical protein
MRSGPSSGVTGPWDMHCTAKSCFHFLYSGGMWKWASRGRFFVLQRIGTTKWYCMFDILPRLRYYVPMQRLTILLFAFLAVVLIVITAVVYHPVCGPTCRAANRAAHQIQQTAARLR